MLKVYATSVLDYPIHPMMLSIYPLPVSERVRRKKGGVLTPLHAHAHAHSHDACVSMNEYIKLLFVD